LRVVRFRQLKEEENNKMILDEIKEEELSG
jgi:hypothetical protein